MRSKKLLTVVGMVTAVMLMFLSLVTACATPTSAPTPAPAPAPAPAPTPAPAPKPPVVLSIEMEPAGHWHVTRSKTLNFTVADDAGNPEAGLNPTVTIKSLDGTLVKISANDNGDGSYSADYTAIDVGTGYAMAYSVSFSFEHEGTRYVEAWPVEVVRDGNERIMPTLGGTVYSYQVRYAWVPGRVAPGDEVTMYFEPRRALQTGDQLNTEQPWRNTFNHLPDLENISVVVETVAGSQVATLTPTYSGLGIYQAKYTPTSAGEYKVSFLFIDPFNGYTIDKAETSYPLVVRS